MKQRQLLNKLNIKFIENEPVNNETITINTNLSLLISSWFIYLVSLIFNILFLINLLPQWMNYVYIYTYGLIFGNSIYIFFLMFGIFLVFQLVNKLFINKCYSFGSRLIKLRWWDFERELNKMLIKISIILSIWLYIIFYFIQKRNFFEYDWNNYLYNLFTKGWWNNFIDIKKIETNHLNVFLTTGFIIDFLYNVLSMLTILFPLLISIILIIIIILKITNFKIKYKIKKMNIYDFESLIKNKFNSLKIILTDDLDTYLKFLIHSCNYFKINYLELPFLKLNKLILNKIKDEVILSCINSYINSNNTTNEEHQINLNQEETFNSQENGEQRDNIEILDEMFK
ncbi:hypothetical protein RRG58_05700 [Mycoplasmopsis cynos]|nr:hypothetical protein [Mycoplasmopsis felis]WQQ11955.1 hypothetical protein RRG50_01715 [Mycoplasmopsis felis]